MEFAKIDSVVCVFAGVLATLLLPLVSIDPGRLGGFEINRLIPRLPINPYEIYKCRSTISSQ